MKTKITLLGDICPTPDTEALFKSGNEKKMFGDVLDLIQSSDLSICNLEFPLIDNGKAVSKTGPILKGSTSYIQVFKKAGFNLLSLANNHIKDCGPEGVLSTIAACANNNISIVGAGANLNESKKLYTQEINGIKLGVLAFAEQEFNVAGENEAGSSYLDVYTDFDRIKQAKEVVDYLLIIFHGGIEYYKNPSPELQKKCRKMIACGADLVTCQHSHCIGTLEEFEEGTILYGQGNSVFGYRKNNASWNTGLVLQLELEKHAGDIKATIAYIPIEAHENGGIQLAPDPSKILQDLKEDSKRIQDATYIYNAWVNFCESKKSMYLPQALGLNRWLIHLNRLSKNRLISLLYSKKKLQTVHNIIRCESHNEVIKTILRTLKK